MKRIISRCLLVVAVSAGMFAASGAGAASAATPCTTRPDGSVECMPGVICDDQVGPCPGDAICINYFTQFCLGGDLPPRP